MKDTGKFRKHITFFLIAFLAQAICLIFPARAQGFITAVQFDDSVISETMTAVLMDADTGDILYSKDPDEIIYPASTTKIMTALLAIELNGNTTDGVITVGPEVTAFSYTSSLFGLKNGASVSIKDLLYGLLLVSGNDAAAALAVHFGGSEEGFVRLMNQKAASLGMNNTNFANPHGLDLTSLGQDHHSTASDMAKLARAAYQNPILMEIMGTRTYVAESTDLNTGVREDQLLRNTNYLLATSAEEPSRGRTAQYLYPGTTGMKTGFLRNVNGYKTYGCLVASASRYGRNLIAAIFADTSDSPAAGTATQRWRAAISMFEYGFSGYVDVNTAPYAQDYLTRIQLSGFSENDPEGGLLEVGVSQSASVPPFVRLDTKTAYELENGALSIDVEPRLDSVRTPVMKGTVVGELAYKLKGETLFTVPLAAQRSVFAEGEEEIAIDYYGLPRPEPFPWRPIIAGTAGVGAGILLFFILRRDGRREKEPASHEGDPDSPLDWNDSSFDKRKRILRERMKK